MKKLASQTAFNNNKIEWSLAPPKMKNANKPIDNTGKVPKHAELQSIINRLNEHCGKIKTLADAFEAAQTKNPNFNIDQPFDSTKSSMTRTVLMKIVATYESTRSDLQKIAQVKGPEFENLFPKLAIIFETYYSVALSMLNLIYQMQHMKIYCQRLLSTDILQS